MNRIKLKMKPILKIQRKYAALKEIMRGKSNKVLEGIIQEKIIVGPETVQIDITNKCNSSCIGCWIHSPLLPSEKYEDTRKEEISYEKIIQLIKDLKKLGTKRIILSGGGEPLMHPQSIEIIKQIKKSKISLTLITNFNLITINKLHSIIKSFKKIYLPESQIKDEILISVWAGDAKTYVRTHPNQTEKSFEKLKTNLIELNRLSSEKNNPRIRILNVINSENYKSIQDMIQFGIDTNTSEMEFNITDIMPETNKIGLAEKEKKELKIELEKIKELILKQTRINFYEYIKQIDNKEYGYLIDKIERDFEHRINDRDYLMKFVEQLSILQINKLKYHLGILKEFCLTYNNESKSIDIFGIQKIINILSGKKEVNDINTMPCYQGYSYTRIMANGNVLPCCKAAKHPLGNINDKSFQKIWTSLRYEEFRHMALKKTKDNPYFNKIKCLEGCDNYIENKRIHHMLQDLGVNKNVESN